MFFRCFNTSSAEIAERWLFPAVRFSEIFLWKGSYEAAFVHMSVCQWVKKQIFSKLVYRICLKLYVKLEFLKGQKLAKSDSSEKV